MSLTSEEPMKGYISFSEILFKGKELLKPILSTKALFYLLAWFIDDKSTFSFSVCSLVSQHWQFFHRFLTGK